jgi:predicted ATPase
MTVTDERTRYIHGIHLADTGDLSGYPFDLPAVRRLREEDLELPGGITFLVGENGSGKSTLLEAIAVAAGMNAEGGSKNYRFTTRATEYELGDHIILRFGPRKPRDRFFLRAESYYNVATETERLGPLQVALFGGISPHERSHGESFLDAIRHRFHDRGLYLLDEPEAALSPRGCMAALSRLSELASRGCQIIVATHSPILLAVPGATIYEIDDDGEIEIVSYDDALPVRMTRSFLEHPDRFLQYLLQ